MQAVVSHNWLMCADLPLHRLSFLLPFHTFFYFSCFCPVPGSLPSPTLPLIFFLLSTQTSHCCALWTAGPHCHGISSPERSECPHVPALWACGSWAAGLAGTAPGSGQMCLVVGWVGGSKPQRLDKYTQEAAPHPPKLPKL